MATYEEALNAYKGEVGRWKGELDSAIASGTPEANLGNLRNQLTTAASQNYYADLLNSYGAETKDGDYGKLIADITASGAPEEVINRTRQNFSGMLVKGGIPVTKAGVEEQAKNQAAVAAGTMKPVQIGTGTGYVPTGSAAAKQIEGQQAGTVSPTNPTQQFQAGMQGNTATQPGIVPVAPSPQIQATNYANEVNAKYQDALSQVKGTPAPADGGVARSTAQSIFGNQGLGGSVLDSVLQSDPNLINLSTEIQNFLNPQTTQTTFRQEYDKLFKEKGLEQINTDLMNMEKVIKGTEDDLRAEITKVGGFATDSQIMALTAARNKTLINSYSNLLQKKTQAEEYINNMLGFEEKDRAAAADKLDKQLNLGFKLAEMQQTMQNNARTALNNIVTQVGYDGLLKSTGGDAYYTGLVEKTLGLGSGGLANLSAMQAKQRATEEQKAQLELDKLKKDVNAKDLQFVSGTDNQRSGYFDKSTGVFTPLGGGGSSGTSPTTSSAFSNTDDVKAFQQANGLKVDGIVGPQTRAAMDKAGIVDLNGVVDTILGSGKFTKPQAEAIRKAITNGEDPFTVVKNQAKALMTGANQTKIESYETAQNALNNLEATLNQYYAAGGETGILTGNYEKVVNKLGQVNNPKLVSIATQIQQNLQIYRNAVSGTAYSVQEGADIASIFPGINKSQGLNEAIIKGRREAFKDGIDGAYRATLGSAYDKLKDGGTSGTSTGVNFGDVLPKITLNESKKEAYIPRSVWTTLGSRMDALIKEFKDDGYTLLVN